MCARSTPTRSSSRRLFLLSSGPKPMLPLLLGTAWYSNTEKPSPNRFVARIYSLFLLSCTSKPHYYFIHSATITSSRCSTISLCYTIFFFLVWFASQSHLVLFNPHVSQPCICFSSAINQTFFSFGSRCVDSAEWEKNIRYVGDIGR